MVMRRTTATLSAMAGLLAGLLTAAAPTLADRALIVGIDAYQRDPRIGPLGGAVNDARMMRDFLVERAGYRPEDVKLLLDGAATRAAILEAFETWLIGGTRPGERVFFHFSGHGTQVPERVAGSEPDGLDEALVPVDAYFDDTTRAARNLIIDDELEAVFARLEERQVTVVVDSCHSGTITRSLADPAVEGVVRTPLALAAAIGVQPSSRSVAAHRGEIAILPSTPNRTVWTAVSAHQLAFEDLAAQPRSGFFTRRFVEVLSRDGEGLSHAGLIDRLQGDSRRFCERLGRSCGLGLTPTLEVHRSLLPTPVLGSVQGHPPQPLDPAAAAAALDQAPGIAQDEVRLEILPGAQTRLGDSVRFRVTSGFDGHLLLLDINPAGQLVQLYPNRFSAGRGRGDEIARGRPLTLPDATYGFEFRVREPLGEGTLIAIVTADPVDFSDIAAPARALVPVMGGEAVDYLTLIAERLREPWTGDEVNRRPRWSMARTAYRTER